MRTPLVLSLCLLSPPAFLGAEEVRFRPEVSFPDGIVYASIASGGRLEERLAGTLLGRMATHPGTRRAFEGFAAFVKEQMGPRADGVRQMTGKTPLELLRLVRGEAALHVGITTEGMPAVALALELGTTREEILGVRSRLKAVAEQATGSPLETVSVEGLEATAWPGPAGPVLEAVIGTHLVIASTRDLFGSIAAAHGTKPETAEPREARHPDLASELAVNDREALLLVDVDALRGILLENVPAREREDVEKVLRVAGLDRVTSLGGALGFRDGGAESAWRLGMKDGPGGILGVIAKSLPGLGDLDEALARIPAAAGEVQAGRIDIGGLLRGIDAAVREVYPEVGGQLEKLYVEAERAGVSVKDDLFTLGDVAACSFSIGPPAGGLFPDEIALIETGSLEPCWRFLEKVGAALGTKPRSIGGGGAVTYLNLTDGRLVEWLRQALLGSPGGGMWTPSLPELLFLMAGSAGLARADAGDGWTAFSALPQAVIRHLEIHSKGPRLASAPGGAELAALIRREAKGAAAIMVSRGGGSILAVYNTLLPLANAFHPFLRTVGIDPAELPPGEAFLGEVKPGWVRLSVDPKGFTLRGHRALETRAGVLAGVFYASFGAGFMVPMLSRGRGEAYGVHCANNLKQLYGYGLSYSDRSGTRAFPHSEEGSLASLQVLIDFDPEGLEPRIFVCPSHGAREPVVDGEKIVLAPDTTSYEVVPWRLKNTALNAILMYDREPAHRGRRNVLFSDGSVQSMEEAEFQRALREQRERFSRAEAEAAPKKAAPRKKAARKKKAEE